MLTSVWRSPCPPPFAQIYYWQHIEPSAVGSYATLAVVDAAGVSRTLQLSGTHYLPMSHDPSGACAALAAATTSEATLPAWSTAALVRGRPCVAAGPLIMTPLASNRQRQQAAEPSPLLPVLL